MSMFLVALTWYWLGLLSKFFGCDRSGSEWIRFSANARFFWKTASTLDSLSEDANELQPVGSPIVAQVSISGVQPMIP